MYIHPKRRSGVNMTLKLKPKMILQNNNTTLKSSNPYKQRLFLDNDYERLRIVTKSHIIFMFIYYLTNSFMSHALPVSFTNNVDFCLILFILSISSTPVLKMCCLSIRQFSNSAPFHKIAFLSSMPRKKS